MLINIPNLNVFINTNHILEVSQVIKPVKKEYYKIYIHMHTGSSTPHTYTLVYDNEKEANDMLANIIYHTNRN